MQAKYLHLCFVCSILLMVLIAIFTLLYQNDKINETTSVDISTHSSLSNVTIDRNRLEKIKVNLAPMNNAKLIALGADISILGYAPASSYQTKSNSNHNKASAYDISMSIVFNNNKYCVINNRFFREGESISKNVLVETIEKNRVLIKEYGNLRWHRVTKETIRNKDIIDENFKLSLR